MDSSKYFLAAFLSLLLITSAWAIPGLPHQFYGTVLVNGSPASGATVTAKISGVAVGSATSAAGKYGYNPDLFFAEDPNNTYKGKTITFYINGIAVNEGTKIFENGGYTEFNISIGTAPVCGDGTCNGTETCVTCTQDCGACPAPTATPTPAPTPVTGGGGGGSGGGGGGGGGTARTPTPTPTPADQNASGSTISGTVGSDSCTGRNCDDSNPCTKDTCRDGICYYSSLDGITCGEEKECVNGECVSMLPPTPVPTATPIATGTPVPIATQPSAESMPLGFFGLGLIGDILGLFLILIIIISLILLFLTLKRKKSKKGLRK